MSQDVSSDADQVELAALASGYAAIDSGAEDELMAGVLDDLAADSISLADSEEWQRNDLIRDDSVGLIHEELARRSSLLRQAYPFDLDEGTLVYAKDRHSSVYEFLLSASSLPHWSGPYAELPRMFERVATRLVAIYFGGNAKAMHVGWPRDGNTSFKAVADLLHRCTGEWHWAPQEKLDPAVVKDGGCDFVVWLHPSDGRKIGQLFVLGQCACGNNWQSKYADLDLKDIQKWFNPLSIVDPVFAFTTPRHVDDDLLLEGSRKAGLLFDRARLVLITSPAGVELFDSETLRKMDDLTALVRDG